MDLNRWMRTYLPTADPPLITFDTFNVDLTSELKMYSGLSRGLRNILEKISCTEYEVCRARLHEDINAREVPRNEDEYESHLVLLPTTARRLYETGPGVEDLNPQSGTSSLSTATQSITASSQASSKDEDAPATARLSWLFADMIIEAVEADEWPEFSDNSPELARTHTQAVENDDPLVEHVGHILAHQHRLFLFTVIFCGSHARFQRWDRAGAIVSTAFNYLDSPEILVTFFYKLYHGDQVSPEARGHDTTVSFASPSEAELFRAIPDSEEVKKLGAHVVAKFAEAATPGWPIFRLRVSSPWSTTGKQVRADDPVKTCRILVGRPIHPCLSALGRGIRGFVGWNMDDEVHRAVYIKDYWRSDRDPEINGPSEYTYYQTLWEGTEEIRKTLIPTVLGGGDVAPRDGSAELHVTRGKKLRRIHCRLVIKQICQTIEDFKSLRCLTFAVLCAVVAHRRAWEQFGILHGDVSVGNILLYTPPNRGTPLGLLSDWDLAKPKALLSMTRQRLRSGTWRFMSAALQNFPKKAHEVSDDLESFAHVLRWLTYQYLPHSMSTHPDEVRLTLQLEFDYYSVYRATSAIGQEEIRLGGYGKLAAVCSPRLGFETLLQQHQDHPFTLMLSDLSKLFVDHYELWDLPYPRPHPPLSQPEPDSDVPVHAVLDLLGGTQVEPQAAQPNAQEASSQTSDSVSITPTTSQQKPAASGVDLPSARAWFLVATVPLTPDTSPLVNHDQFLRTLQLRLTDSPAWPQVWKRPGRLIQTVPGEVGDRWRDSPVFR